MIRRFIFIVTILASSALFAADAPKPAMGDIVAADREMLVQLPDSKAQTLQLLLWNQTNGASEIARGVAEKLSISPEDAEKILQVRADDGYVGIIIDLRKGPKNIPPRANEAADRAVEVATQILERSVMEGPVNRLQSLRNMRDSLQRKREELVNEAEKQQTVLRDRTGSVDVSPATVRQLLFSLQTQHESAEIDLAAKQARRDALAEQIAKFSDELKAKVKDDPVAAELQKVVDARQESMRRAEDAYKAGAAPNAELGQAMSAVAEARAKLLERREQAAAAAGGETIAGWNRELMNLSVEMAELKARLKAVSDRLDRYSGAVEIINNSEQRQQTLTDLSTQMIDVEKRLLDAEANLRSQRVNISVIGTSNQPATQPAP
jgi:hypothetical protein